MKVTSPTNTRWRDVYGRMWAAGLVAALAVHAAVFLFLPDRVSDRLHEAMIPSPNVLLRAGAPGSDMEAVTLRAPSREEPEETPPEPEPEEEVVEPTVSDAVSEEISIAEVASVPSETDGTTEGVPEGEGETGSAGAPGGGAVCSPRPLHLAVPRVPRGVDKKRARGESVHLLIEVQSDGTVGEVKVEEGSRIVALDEAALAAARQMRYAPSECDIAWTRAEMRF